MTSADGTPPPGRMVATPFPVHENGRSVALTGMFPSKSIRASAKVLMLRNRFIVLLLLKLRISAYYVLKWELFKKHHTNNFETPRPWPIIYPATPQALALSALLSRS